MVPATSSSEPYCGRFERIARFSRRCQNINNALGRKGSN